MTESEKNKPREDFLNLASDLDKYLVVGAGLKSASHQERARAERDKIGLESVLNDPLASTGNPAMTQAQFNGMTNEEKQNARENGFARRISDKRFDAKKALAENADIILRGDDGKYVPELTEYLFGKETRGMVDEYSGDKGKQFLAPYTTFKGIEEAIKNSATMNSEQKRQVLAKFADNFAKREYKNQVDNNRPAESAESASNIARIAAQHVATENDIVETMKEDLKKVSEELKKISGSEDHDQVAAGYVANAIKALANSGHDDKESSALGMAYRAHKKYTIGSRDFGKVYE